MTPEPIKKWKPAKKGTTEKYAGILGFPDLEEERREQLKQNIAEIIHSNIEDCGWDKNDYQIQDTAEKILKEIEK
jgi:hypothetical protein